MRTVEEAFAAVGALEQKLALRDELILDLADRVKQLEHAKDYLVRRPPMPPVPYPVEVLAPLGFPISPELKARDMKKWGKNNHRYKPWQGLRMMGAA